MVLLEPLVVGVEVLVNLEGVEVEEMTMVHQVVEEVLV